MDLVWATISFRGCSTCFIAETQPGLAAQDWACRSLKVLSRLKADECSPQSERRRSRVFYSLACAGSAKLSLRIIVNALAHTPELTALVVDDEPQIRRLLTVTLEANGYRVVAVENGREAVIMAAQYRPDIVILDLGLPDLDGQVVLKRLREWSSTPVIILTVKDDPSEKIAALDAGADDFVTKPFHAGELLARMRAALRHSAAHDEPAVFKSGDLVVDLACRQVMRGRKEVKLTSTEYSLLRFLIRHAGKVLTHRQILQEVWGPGHDDRTHYLRVYMAHLREKLEADPSQPKLFLTEPGVGYRFVSEPASGA